MLREAKHPPEKVKNQEVRTHDCNAPGRIDLGLCVDKEGEPYIDAVHIVWRKSGPSRMSSNFRTASNGRA